MSENNNSNDNGSSTEGFSVDELRNSAIKECGDWLDRITTVLEEQKDERDILNNAITVVHESRLTWLERLAGVLGIDVRRGVFDKHMGLYWSDTDGNILLDEESGLPLHEVDTFESLVKLTTTKEAAVKIAKGEEVTEGEAQ
tara:strand:+ start:100 stop:525 length:426 start_codon:yes stop_codon:yes gene_type:complete